HASLTLSGGVLYGTTMGSGGISENGTVFSVKTDGSGYAVLKTFSPLNYNNSSNTQTNDDGAEPSAPLLLSEGVLYGTTQSGGSSGCGTLFKLNTDGTAFTVLKTFLGGSDGRNSQSGLTASGGVLFGTTTYPYGTVFSINTDGTGYTVL